MHKYMLKLGAIMMIVLPALSSAVEITGSGSMLPVALLKSWGEAYAKKSPEVKINYLGSSPADGIKRLLNKEVQFSCIDTPLDQAELSKQELKQLPLALGAIVPIVNLPSVTPGRFRLDAKVLADIFLGNIKRWNDAEIAALNPGLPLPDADIVVIHRASPPGLKTIIGDYLAKNNPQWRATKGDTMAGAWPVNSIEVNNPAENFDKLMKTPYSIGYGTIAIASSKGLSYVKMKNKAGNYVSPDDESVMAAAEAAQWDAASGYDVELIDQKGANSWPLTMATFVLLRKNNEKPELVKEFYKYIDHNLRFGGMNTVSSGYIQLPTKARSAVRKSLEIN